MNKIWLSVLMISFVLFNPIKTLAQEKNCGWCGTSCIDFNERKGIMCTMIAPPENRQCVLISNRCLSTPISGVTRVPVEKVLPTMVCEILYWIDNNSTKCESKKFCGMYMYQGLKTFENLKDCNNALVEIKIRPTEHDVKPVMLGDANGDGKIDLVDFSIWKTEYKNFAQQPLTSIPVTWKSDFNSDGLVDMTDFQLWKINYLTKFLKKN